MKKIFKVLWFDDEEENIRLIEDELKDYIIEFTAGEYILEIEDFRTFEIGAELTEKVKDPMYNLIITDFHLLEERTGGELLSIAKDNQAFKDILIYSSNAQALREAIEGVDGIYYRAFDNLPNLVKKIKAVIFESIYRESYAVLRSKDNVQNS